MERKGKGGGGGRRERRKEERKKDFDRTTKQSPRLCGKQRNKELRKKEEEMSKPRFIP